MPAGLDNLKHVVVLMMSSRSFDHMLGGLKAVDPRINGLTGSETNPDISNELVKVQPLAEYQGQLDPDPSDRFSAVHFQLFGGAPVATPTMEGFVRSYYQQHKDVAHSRKIMYYFPKEKLPVLTTLATEFAVFNGWFSSIPGPTLCNRAFAHYGTSFGQVSMEVFYHHKQPQSVYERMLNAGQSAKIYQFDQESPSLEVVNLLQYQPRLFGTYDDFLQDCNSGNLPQYSFVEPNHVHHEVEGGEAIASDQHPDHDVQQGEVFVATVYNAIRQNPELWKSTALLIVYDEHGGIYDHVSPPPYPKDGFVATPDKTGVPGLTFEFDRLGVRVPAILVSPWIPKSTVVPGPGEPGGRSFEHASIPGTVTSHFIGDYPERTAREKQAPTFLDLLSDTMRPDDDCPVFELAGADTLTASNEGEGKARAAVGVTARQSPRFQELAGYQSDVPEGRDLLNISGEVEALACVLAAREVYPPLSLGLFGDWGTGKSFFMRQLESRIRVLQEDAQAARGDSAFCENIVQIAFNAWNYIDTNLWASLTSEIFEGLASELAKRRGGDSKEERARVIAAASSSLTVLADAERKKREADEVLRQTEERLAALQNSKASIEASLSPFELLNDACRFAITQPEVQGYIENAGKELNVEQFDLAAGKLKSEILELHGIWNTILFTMQHTEKLWIWVVAFCVALGLGWATSFLLKQFSLAGLLGQATAILAAASSFLACFFPSAQRVLKLVQGARDAKQQLIDQKQLESTKALNIQRSDMVKKVEGAQRDVEAATTHASALKDQLAQLRDDRRMADYILQRNESTDYTQHLGLIARVRTDFKQLSALLRDVKEEADSEMKRRQNDRDHEQKLFPHIDRIILYIDDLDRCPEKNVVEVLQAVNLLLAFPLCGRGWGRSAMASSFA